MDMFFVIVAMQKTHRHSYLGSTWASLPLRAIADGIMYLAIAGFVVLAAIIKRSVKHQPIRW
jgi:hypothetical protein